MKTRLYVLMHPLFDKYSGGLISKSGSKHYRHNLKNLLIRSDSKVLVCESKCDIEETKSFVVKTNPKLEVLFIETKFSESTPVEGWENLFKMVEQVDPLEIIVGGANLSGDEESGYGECVGNLYYCLRQQFCQIRIDLSLCFPCKDADARHLP